MREYGIRRHRVYCHYPMEVMRIPDHTGDRVVIFLEWSGVYGQPRKAGAVAVRVRVVGQETESMVERIVYGAGSPERYKRWRTWLGR